MILLLVLDSVCEECNPDVKTDGWSLKPGYFHDRDFATELDGFLGSPERNRGGLISGPNNYGMIFQKNTNGCQLMPEIAMPASPTSNLDAALANPVSGDIAAVGTRLTSAFAMIESATKENQGAEIAAAWYHANPATCTKAANFCPGGAGAACVLSDVCAHTPAAHADAMAAAFETNMHYGHSVARIKVMQALAILANDLATGTTTANMADIKKDVLAHMLVPMYQGAIQAAHKMDDPNTAAAGLADFAAYWNIIKDKVTFEANDKARLEALAVPPIGTNNFCTVRALLHRNLPDGSKLLYTHDWIPCPGGKAGTSCPGAMGTTHATEVTGARHLTAAETFQNDDGVVEAVHLSAADIGILTASRSETDGSEMVCPFLSPWVAGDYDSCGRPDAVYASWDQAIFPPRTPPCPTTLMRPITTMRHHAHANAHCQPYHVDRGTATLTLTVVWRVAITSTSSAARAPRPLTHRSLCELFTDHRILWQDRQPFRGHRSQVRHLHGPRRNPARAQYPRHDDHPPPHRQLLPRHLLRRRPEPGHHAARHGLGHLQADQGRRARQRLRCGHDARRRHHQRHLNQKHFQGRFGQWRLGRL